MDWLLKCMAIIGHPRRILVAFLLWRIKRNIEFISFYIRKYRSLYADLITRADAAKLRGRVQISDVKHGVLPWRLANFRRLGYTDQRQAAGAGNVATRGPFPLDGSSSLPAAEWGGSNSLPLMVAHRFGCVMPQYRDRWNDAVHNPDWAHRTKIDVFSGKARTAQGRAEFSDVVSDLHPRLSIVIPPSDVIPPG